KLYRSGALRLRVFLHQRGTGLLTPLEQPRATDARDRPLPAEMHECLIAHDAAAGREQELVEARMRADGSHQRGYVHRAGALAGDLDVIDVSAIAHLELEHCVHFVLASA